MFRGSSESQLADVGGPCLPCPLKCAGWGDPSRRIILRSAIIVVGAFQPESISANTPTAACHAAAVADPVLDLRIELRHCRTLLREIEHRVVAEAIAPCRPERDDPLARAVGRAHVAIRRRQRHRAAEPRRASVPWHAGQRVEQLAIAVGVRRARPGIARGIDSRRAVQRIHLQPGIVGPGPQPVSRA